MRTPGRCFALLVLLTIFGGPSNAWAADPPVTTLKTEADWVARDITAELQRRPGADAARPLDTRPATAAAHMWDPAGYVAIAETLVARLRRASKGSTELLGTLTTPRAETIEQRNIEISKRISAEPWSAAAHEDAALLLGAFALREAAGAFSDTRPALSRMTAHLAMARALGGDDTSRNAAAAAIIMQTLLGRQQDALDRLARWKKSERDGAAAQWAQALTLRITGDWRGLEHPERATLLERREYARALRDRVAEARVLDFLEQSHPETTADWTRILTETGTSVSTGQSLAASAIGDEIAEASAVWPGAVSRRGDATALLDALNDGPDADSAEGPYRVIDWPMWRAFVQRHLARKMVAIVYLYDHMLKSEKAGEIVTGFDRQFGHSPLYPLVRRAYAFEQPQYTVAMTDARALMAAHPELITAANWTLLTQRWNSKAALPEDVRPPLPWFESLVPLGTAYDVAHRIYGVRGVLLARPELLSALRAVAPFERGPILELARLHRPAPDRFEREVAPLAEYDLAVLIQLAGAAGQDVERYVPIGRRICAMLADDCGWFADYLLDQDREPEAVATYRYFVEHARDRVGVSNNVRWLVMYDYDNGRVEQATKLANEVAEVYSGAGLQTKAALLERMGQYDAAERLFQAAAKRYDQYTELTGFYLRRMRTAAGLKQFEAVSKPLVAKLFAKGMERVTLPVPDTPPTDGVRITYAGHHGTEAGLAHGDVIVAVDGVRVHDDVQMRVVWLMSDDPNISFVAFRDGKYFTVQGAWRERWRSGVFRAYDWRQPIL